MQTPSPTVSPAAPATPAALLAVAFYNGCDYGRRLDRIIARHDRPPFAGPFSHAELVFDAPPRGLSLCCSSSWRDGGVRFKRINLGESSGKWTTLPIPTTPADVQRVRSFCLGHVGGRYDLPGVLAFKFPFVRHRLGWWFCSELCCAALQQIGLLAQLPPHKVSPNRLFHLCRVLCPETEAGRA